jgi:hypothetical protein
VVYSYAPGRRGDYALALLKGYSGVLQTDGYAGYPALADPKRNDGPVTLALCWAHPWTAPRAEGDFSAYGDHGRVQPSIRPWVAALRPPALMVFAAPFPITGAQVRTSRPMRPTGSTELGKT